MGVLKSLTDEYFGKNIRKEDEIDISDLDVEIVSFTDNNKKHHSHGYRVKDGDKDKMARTLKTLIERTIEKRGTECDLNDIDVSNITKMNHKDKMYGDYYPNGVFEKSDFNGDISGWNVSNVKDMRYMFCHAKNFNCNIGGWDVRNVENMKGMFLFAESFNQPIGKWKVSNVEDMESMFSDAKNFNQDLSKWVLKKDCNTTYMFDGCGINDNNKPKKRRSN